MAKQPAPAPRPVDLKLVARVHTVEEIGKTVRTAFVFGGAVGIAYFFSRMVHDLAGKSTAADIGLRFLGTINVSEGLAWVISALCGGIAVKTTRTNRSMAKRLGRLSKLEQEIDPNRSSSQLTPSGLPREEDK